MCAVNERLADRLRGLGEVRGEGEGGVGGGEERGEPQRWIGEEGGF